MNGNGTIPELTCWKLRLKLRGPMLTTSSAPLGFGIDAPFARNAAGEYYMAGSLVKGRLKEAWQELSDTQGGAEWNWERWIGKEPPKRGTQDWGSERGLLQFADFIYQQAGSSPLMDEDVITYRIERDRDTRAVKPGQNQMIQSPFAAGGEYWFEGRVWGILGEGEAAELDQRLQQGLCFVPALGAETTVGYGVIVAVQVSRESEWKKGRGWDRTSDDRWAVSLNPEGPLCLSGRRLAENIFESEPEIAGGVIKGALAATIQRLNGATGRDVSNLPSDAYRDLCEEFSNVRILHAKPVREGTRERPSAIPLSAVKVDKTPRDAAFVSSLTPVNGYAPAFQIDWKEWGDVEAYFGVIQPPRELRVRTQIETDKRRAMDENLFAYRMLAARALNANGDVEEYEWLSEIDFHGVPEARRERVKSQLAGLLRQYGLPGTGKLKTRCVVDRVPVAPRVSVVNHKGDHQDQWVVTLQTPALLCDIAEVGDGLNDALGTYRKYWLQESGDSLYLESLYASQTLVGGEYLWRQFDGQSPYRPYVLTDVGSTFVLRHAGGAPTAKPEDCLTEWQRSGLPIARSVREACKLKGDANDWKRCPYVPQNGFGEIAVDQAWHWEKAL